MSKPHILDLFRVFMEIGFIQVPVTYKPATWLTEFYEKPREGSTKIFFGRDFLWDFASSSYDLEPGQMFRVVAYQQIPHTLTSRDQLEFLQAIEARLLGIVGIGFVLEQLYRESIREELRICGKNLASFGSAESHRVPAIDTQTDHNSEVEIISGNFGRNWLNDTHLLLAFIPIK